MMVCWNNRLIDCWTLLQAFSSQCSSLTDYVRNFDLFSVRVGLGDTVEDCPGPFTERRVQGPFPSISRYILKLVRDRGFRLFLGFYNTKDIKGSATLFLSYSKIAYLVLH